MAQKPFVAFDIETTGLFEGDTPPGITCCATRLESGGKVHVRTFHSDYADVMKTGDIVALVEYLYSLALADVTITTFNGAGFDFRVLAAHIKDNRVALSMCKTLAQSHCDIMFEFACNYGYYSSMASFCAGCGLSGKTGDGADAIEMWCGASATHESKCAVLRYCENDVLCLANLWIHLMSGETICRLTKSGKKQEVSFSLPPLPVDTCKRRYIAYKPDNSWMKEPPNVLDAVNWMYV